MSVLAFGNDIEEKALVGDVEAQLLLARRCDAHGNGEKAVEWLRRAAATGDLAAKTELGRHLLSDPPYNQREGVKWTMDAAGEGSGAAAHLLAVLAASGVCVGQSWRDALAKLQRSAELGLTLAQAELAMLAENREIPGALAAGDEFPQETWERLRRSVDIRKWLVVPQAKLVSKSPRLAIVEKFASAEICDWLIERGRLHLRPARTDDPATGKSRYETARTNSSAELDLSQTDLITHLVRARISALTGPPVMAMEGTAVLHYAVGQQYFPHFDFFDTDSPGYARQVAEFGQRVLTFLCYLNDGYGGGETDFPAVGWRHKGNKGDALFFWNIQPNGQPDRLTQHAGLAPTSGEKWLLSQWVRGRVS